MGQFGSLSRIRASFQKIQEKHKITQDVSIDDITFSLGILSREEDIKAQSWAEEQSANSITYNSYLEVSRLSFAIKAVNDVPVSSLLEDEDTGEKVQSHIYLRKVLMEFPSAFIEALTKKYNEARTDLREKLGLQVVSLDTLLEQLNKTQEAIPSQETIDKLNYSEEHTQTEGESIELSGDFS